MAALPPGYNFLQSLWRTYKQVKNPIGSMEESMARFGGTYSVNLGMRRMIATQDPGFIDYVLKGNHRNYHKSRILTEQLGRFLGNGLLTSNGDYWLKQRRLIQPGFHHERIHALYQIIYDTVAGFLASFPEGKQIDIYPRMNQLAFEIVINTLFNIDVPPATRSLLSRFVNETQDFVIRDVRQPYKSWWFSLSGEVARNMEKARGARESLRDLIVERKSSGAKANDLLDMLLGARYEDNGEPMTEEQLIDEILILIIAGHETTANALSFGLYLLADHPAWQERLREETQALGTPDAVRHHGLQAVINETMRLYPPAWIADRVALKDDRYQQYHIPADTIIVLFYYGVHRNPALWDKAGHFDPNRFLSVHSSKEKPKAFYPFGGGPRLCIGNSFAMAEMAIFLQVALQQFRFIPAGQVPVINPLVTLRPESVLISIEKLRR